MKCEKCGGEWNAPANFNSEVLVCPFCKSPLTPPHENSDVKSALKWIVDNKGIEVYKNAGLINGMLSDIVKGQSAEKRKIRTALSSGAGSLFYNILLRNNGVFRDADVELYLTSLEEYGLSSDFSKYVLNVFLYSVSLPEISTRSDKLEEKPSENGGDSGEIPSPIGTNSLVILLLCGSFIGFGIYGIHHFLNDRSITFFGIVFNTWIKQYFVWCLTFVSAAVACGVFVKRKKKSERKKYWYIIGTIVVLGVFWPTLLGSPGLINDISFGNDPYLLKPGQAIKPYITPLLCSKSNLFVKYTTDAKFEIKEGNKVFASEDSTSFFQEGNITASFPFRDDKTFVAVLDNTSSKEGYKNHFDTEELTINYTIDNKTINNWDYYFKMKTNKDTNFTLTSFIIDVYANDDKWHNICDFHGDFTSESEDNYFFYYHEKLEKQLEGATKAKVTFRYKAISGYDVEYWDSFYTY